MPYLTRLIHYGVCMFISLALISTSQADSIVVRYKGPQDKPLPCILFSDSDTQALPEHCFAPIVAVTRPELFQDFMQKHVAPYRKREANLEFVFYWQQGQSGGHFSLPLNEAIAWIKACHVTFPATQEEIEKRFLSRIPFFDGG